MREVVAEGLLLGVFGAVLGLFAGIGLAPALDQLFKAFGRTCPTAAPCSRPARSSSRCSSAS